MTSAAGRRKGESRGRTTPVDVLAIAAHRDDIELTCGGLLIKAVKQGHRVGIVDLTAGEAGTRGDAKTRADEASRSASIIGATARENLGFPDAGIMYTEATRLTIALAIRRYAPHVVIAPALYGRHPDHRITGELVRDACFIAGLAKIAPEVPPHRPHKLLHCTSFREDWDKPTFVVDISDEFEQKVEAVECFASQFAGATRAGEVQPNGESLIDIMRHLCARYGSLIHCRYGEPFYTAETMRVDDVMQLGVATF